MDFLDAITGFVQRIRFDDIPAPVVQRAKQVAMDSLGIMYAGGAERHVGQMSLALKARGSTGNSFVFTDGRRGDAGDAALLNGVSLCTHVAEDGHKYARGHVSAYVVPAVLAVAEERDLDGRGFLTALVAGYEIASRLGMACRVRKGMHPSGTWGSVGCAAAVAGMMQFDARGIRETMNVAAPLTLATSWNAAEEGATVRDLYSGSGGSLAVWAPRWVACGITGSADDVSAVFGKVSSENFDKAVAGGGLGERWEILRNYFKVHACCRNFQSGIDAALELRAQIPAIDQIRAIRVETFSAPVEHNASAEPHNILAARESLPVSLALALIHGKLDQTVYTEENVASPAVRQLSALTSMKLDPELDAKYPDARPTRITIEMADRSRVVNYQEVALGDPLKPVSDETLRAKFLGNIAPLGCEAAAEVLAMIDALDDLASIRGLTARFTPTNRAVAN